MCNVICYFSEVETGETIDGEETFAINFEMDMEHESYELIQVSKLILLFGNLMSRTLPISD